MEKHPVIIVIFFYFFLLSNPKVKAECFEPNSSSVISSDKTVYIGKCIKPVKSPLTEGAYGWSILQDTLDKKIYSESMPKYYYTGQLTDSPIKEKFNLQSSKVDGGRCSVLFNTPGLFYKEKNVDGRPVSDWDTEKNLKEFWKSMEDYDSKEKRTSRGFYDYMVFDPSLKMHDASDDSTRPEGKSTCSAVGMCTCPARYNCTELSSYTNAIIPEPFGNQGDFTRVLDKDSFQYDVNKDIYKKMENWCYELKTCETGDKSPYKLCMEEQESSTLCKKFDRRCLYTSTCKLPPTSTSYDLDNLPECEHSFECGSGYCEMLPAETLERLGEAATTTGENLKKVCMPYAICAPECVGINQAITRNDQMCCSGLLSIGGTCRILADGFELPEEMFIDEENAENCNYKISFNNTMDEPQCLGAEHWKTRQDCNATFEWKRHIQTSEGGSYSYCSVNGTRKDDITEDQCRGGEWFDSVDFIRMKYIYYTRLYEGLQWLWGTADSKGSRDYFGVNIVAVKSFERFYELNQSINDKFYELMNEVKIKFSESAQGEGAATGVNTIVALSQMYTELSELDELRSDLYFEVSGVDAVLNGTENNLTLQNLLDLGTSRLGGIQSDTKLSGENVEGGNTLWSNETIFGFFKKINSLVSLNNLNSGKRYDASQGKKDCGLFRQEIGKVNSVCKDKKENPPSPIGCGWGDHGVRDGDCIQEGWRLDDAGGGYHGTPGAGGLVDPIYPGTLNSSLFKIIKDNLYSEVIKRFFNFAKAAGKKRFRSGVNGGSVSSGVLETNIKNAWGEFASENYEMETACIGAIRPTVPGSISLEEAFFIEKYTFGKESLDINSYYDQYRTFTEEQKREKFIDFGSRLLYDFFVRFHFHNYDISKSTYRFYKDMTNINEYNGVVELINGALWLIEFHKINAEMNRKIGSCLQEKAEQLNESLGGGEDQLDASEYKNVVGNLGVDFPNCPPRNNSGGGGGSSAAKGESVELKNSDQQLTDVNEIKNSISEKKKKQISSNKINLSEKGQIGISSSLPGEAGVNKKSAKTSSAKIRAARKKANAKIGETRKLNLKKKKQPTNFLKELGNKLSDFKTPVARLKTISETRNFTPKLVSLGLSEIGDSGDNKKQKNVKTKVKSAEKDVSRSRSKKAYDDRKGSEKKTIVVDLDDDGDDESLSPELKKLLQNAKANAKKYKKEEGDSLFLIISKSYMTSGVTRLLMPKKKKMSKGLPSLKTKSFEKKGKWIE